MQDRTINNALLTLRRQGGSQAKLAEVLLEMRGVGLPRMQNNPAPRHHTARFVMRSLRDGLATCPEIADALAIERPQVGRKDLLHRVYMALRRLEAKGLVKRDGRVWRLAP